MSVLSHCVRSLSQITFDLLDLISHFGTLHTKQVIYYICYLLSFNIFDELIKLPIRSLNARRKGLSQNHL